MQRSFLITRAICLLVATMAVALFSAGCGGSDSSASGGEVTVTTGSLSKAEFVKRADAICKEAREKFTREYTAFAKKVQRTSKTAQEAASGELIEDILIPNFQKDVDEISALGAPKGDEEKVAAFLNALQQQLEEIHERPKILETTVTPLAKAEKLAKTYGLTGCAESFS